jgi:tRNA(Ile)-lysidine synthase
METTAFVGAVEGTIGHYAMDVSRPLVMVSGGPDSTALLRVLVALGAEVAVLHVDHGLRGEESREDARFVMETCEVLGVACEVRNLELGGSNLQEAAREARYRLARDVALARGCASVATGHTADDVAETVLLNLARGAGLRGLSGIPPVRDEMVRPLVERTRREIVGYLERLGQPYRTDPTNLTGKYARNRVRLEVMPVLEELYPGAAANMARAASMAREDLAALEEISAEYVERRGEEVVVRLEGTRAVLRHALRLAFAEVAPERPPLGSVYVEAVLDAGREGTRSFDLPGGVVAAARFGREVAFYRAVGTDSGEVDLIPGTVRLGGWELEVEEVEGWDPAEAGRSEVAYLDLERGPYRVRMAREGDSIRPLGLGGRKGVLRAMMDRKVPKDLRRRTPVVVGAEGEVAWVFRGETGEAYAVTGTTERVYRLEVKEEP